MEWILQDFLVENINSRLFQQFHSKPWDFSYTHQDFFFPLFAVTLKCYVALLKPDYALTLCLIENYSPQQDYALMKTRLCFHKFFDTYIYFSRTTDGVCESYMCTQIDTVSNIVLHHAIYVYTNQKMQHVSITPLYMTNTLKNSFCNFSFVNWWTIILLFLYVS
jgi:hypothetical protein